ncbi:hypothetical protein CDL15_Pgr000280 [Punica granatum]|uniref:non-specific serine/threonine protein kinase n=1 Tax=Punica granatum TaxID=22663 RepID=A0A218Y390_PUNGR|nr:hypothetical protein CDL15_Pgr000280 [Punica granatum]
MPSHHRGVARGLLYLHRYSCLRVIYRDMKAGNILLGENMNPHISDFGLARMFHGTQDVVNTRRVVGTLGYMAPEYAMGGIFSVKSDVYSFGVLMLETVGSSKSTSFYCRGEHLYLLSYAWTIWKEDRGLELIEEAILVDSASSTLVVMKKYIQIGLLCVQDHAADIQNMSSAVLMASGESDSAQQKEPMFTFQSTPEHQIPLPGLMLYGACSRMFL